MKEWTEESVAELRRLKESGLSFREIAKQMGTSRNSVIGKIHRLGIANGRKLFWTDEKKISFREMWLQHEPLDKICDLHGISSSAARKQAERMRLVSREIDKKKPESMIGGMRRGAGGQMIELFFAVGVKERIYEPQATATDILAIKNHQCKWGVGKHEGGWEDRLFCGAGKLEGSSYCALHHSLAYRVLRRESQEECALRLQLYRKEQARKIAEMGIA